MERRTYRQADGNLRPTLLGRLGAVDLKISPVWAGGRLLLTVNFKVT